MALLQAPTFISSLLLPSAAPRSSRYSSVFTSARSQKVSCSERRIWRRCKMSKKDEKLDNTMDRVPFVEEQVRKISATGKICRWTLKGCSFQRRIASPVNEVAAEAKAYVEMRRDEYGFKKPVLHVLRNRMNDAGFPRSEAYLEDDPFKPGPNYLRIPET
ncbi:hypothetical protein KSP40_PGU017437 [Platanthera guangdongensis]|uniref:Uncharacterized protein n=1 Tax=Platanthera guangdongensis TaxID=2320717 RepID=A0ABR2N2W7_9ASPA